MSTNTDHIINSLKELHRDDPQVGALIDLLSRRLEERSSSRTAVSVGSGAQVGDVRIDNAVAGNQYNTVLSPYITPISTWKRTPWPPYAEGRFVNRDNLKTTFRELVQFESKRRALFIRGDKGEGETLFINYCYKYCQQNSLPVIRVSLAHFSPTQECPVRPFDFAEALVEEYPRRCREDFVHWKIQMNKVTGNSWNSASDKQATEQCVSSLLDDLQNIGNNSSVVILIDAYERMNEGGFSELKKWFEEEFLVEMVFQPGRPSKLALVICGRDVPFHDGTNSEQVEIVHDPNLPRLEEDDIKIFLRFLGEDEDDVIKAYTILFKKRNWNMQILTDIFNGKF